jgi:hypothetical protein
VSLDVSQPDADNDAEDDNTYLDLDYWAELESAEQRSALEWEVEELQSGSEQP